MAKLTLSDLSSLTDETAAIAAINANSALIETALENTFSRDGTSPNTMSTQLDMNSNKITNLATPTAGADAATKAYVDSVSSVADIGDLTELVNDAEAAATAAEAAQTAAETAAGTLDGTSTTSLAIGTGSKVFTTQSGKQFDAGNFILAVRQGDSSEYMFGQSTAYSGTSLTVDVVTTGGSGTHNDWNIFVSGARGATGTATLDITGQTEGTTLAADDYFVIYDASATANRKISTANIYEGVNNLTAETAPATDDLLLIYDTSASTADKITLENTFKVINNLTVDSAPVQSTDYVPTYDASATGAKKVLLNKIGVGKQTVPILAASWIPATTNGCASLAKLELGNGYNIPYLAFDASTIESAYLLLPSPKGWDAGTLTYRVAWTHPATTTNFDVMWDLTIGTLSNSTALNTTISGGVSVTDTGGTTSDMYFSPESSAITPSNTGAKQDWFLLRLRRVANDAADTMAVDAYFIGLELYITTDTNTDN